MKQMFLTWVLVSFFSFNLEAKLLNHPNKIIKSYWGVDSVILSQNLLINDKDKLNIKNKFKIRIEESIFKSYIINDSKKNNRGFALLYTDQVRTKNMTLILLMSTSGELEAIEVVAFSEPMEYKPAKKWLDKNYKNLKLSEFINSNKTANISGATLTAQSVFKSAKIITAVWYYLRNKNSKAGK